MTRRLFLYYSDDVFHRILMTFVLSQDGYTMEAKTHWSSINLDAINWKFQHGIPAINMKIDHITDITHSVKLEPSTF